jgi:hypothetical protein
MAAVQAPSGHRTTSQEMAAVHAPIGHRTSKPMPAMQPLVPVTAQPLPAPSVAPDSAPFERQSVALDSAPFERQSVAPDSAPFERQSASHAQQSYARQAEAFARESEAFARQAEPSMYPALRPRSSRTILLAFVGALVLGAGGVLGFMLNKSEKPATAAVEQQQPPTQMDTVPGKPAEPATVEAKSDSKHEAAAKAEAKSDSKHEAATKAEPSAEAKAEAKIEAAVPTVPVVDTQPTVPDPPRGAESVTSPAKQEANKPDVKKAAVQAAGPGPKKPIVQKQVRPTKPRKPSTAKEPKEQTWDPNSPFLPQ